jgi:hypothetical protein
MVQYNAVAVSSSFYPSQYRAYVLTLKILVLLLRTPMSFSSYLHNFSVYFEPFVIFLEPIVLFIVSRPYPRVLIYSDVDLASSSIRVIGIYIHIKLQRVPFLQRSDNCCYRQIQHKPHYHPIDSQNVRHKPVTYLPKSELLTQIVHLSADVRLY